MRGTLGNLRTTYTFSVRNIRLLYVDRIFEKSERPSVIKVWKYLKWGCAATCAVVNRRDVANTMRFCDLVSANVRRILDSRSFGVLCYIKNPL